jgi:hypothetical protein
VTLWLMIFPTIRTWEIRQKLSVGPADVEIDPFSLVNAEAATPAGGSIIAIRRAFAGLD